MKETKYQKALQSLYDEDLYDINIESINILQELVDRHAQVASVESFVSNQMDSVEIVKALKDLIKSQQQELEGLREILMERYTEPKKPDKAAILKSILLELGYKQVDFNKYIDNTSDYLITIGRRKTIKEKLTTETSSKGCMVLKKEVDLTPYERYITDKLREHSC